MDLSVLYGQVAKLKVATAVLCAVTMQGESSRCAVTGRQGEKKLYVSNSCGVIA